jgi:transposase
VYDVCCGAGIKEVQVAHPKDPAWCNRTVKTDQRDADLLAQLSASGQLRTVHMPDRDVRGWREIITFRHELVRERTRIKNRIRSLLINQGIATGKLWTKEGLARLGALAVPFSTCQPGQGWQGILGMELARLGELTAHLIAIENRLDAMAQASPMAHELLKEVGIGERSAEIIAAMIDNPLRFRHRKQVGAYFGFAPRVYQSGAKRTLGRITKAGNELARAILVEVVHLGIRRGGWMRDTYEHYMRNDPTRKKRALIATARRLLIRLWAKLRDLRRRAPDTPTIPGCIA